MIDYDMEFKRRMYKMDAYNHDYNCLFINTLRLSRTLLDVERPRIAPCYNRCISYSLLVRLA